MSNPYQANVNAPTVKVAEFKNPAQGFLNISFRTKEGGKRKLVGHPLKAGTPAEKALADYFEAGTQVDPEFVQKWVMANIIADYQVVGGREGAGFAMPEITMPSPQ